VADKKANGENNCNLFLTAIKNGDLETVKIEIEKIQGVRSMTINFFFLQRLT